MTPITDRAVVVCDGTPGYMHMVPVETARELEQMCEELATKLIAARQTHYYCEDTWYSCPAHKEGCADERRGPACDCGAAEANASINATIAKYQSMKEKAK